jgi:hypothetical protein
MCVAVFAARWLASALPLAAVAATSVIAGAAAYLAVLWFGFGSRGGSLIDIARTVRGHAAVTDVTASIATPEAGVDVIRP